jgi:hypothetical protein
MSFIRLYLQANTQFIELRIGRDLLFLTGRPKPTLLPVYSASMFTSVVPAAIAARTTQNHDVVRRKNPQRMTIDTGFMNLPLNAKSLATPTHHFRHKRKAIQRAIVIERTQDFIR